MRTDTLSKNLLISILHHNGYTNIIDTDINNKYEHWDVEATKNGKKYLFECKSRRFEHTKYGDNCVEELKYKTITEAIESGYAQKGYVISFFADNYVAINNIYDEHETNQRYAPKTTDFKKTDKVLKTFCDYKNPKFKKISLPNIK